MKKLITLILLLLSTLIFSQKTEFTEVYNYLKLTEANGVSKPWIEGKTEVIFNYNDDPYRIVLSGEGVILSLIQYSTTELGLTPRGEKYQLFRLISSEGTKYILQYFDNQDKYGVKIMVESGQNVEFNR